MRIERQYRAIRIFLALIWVVLYIAVLIIGMAKADNNSVYYGHGGMPAPCPLPKTGYWPRDCH
jgi:hypothetical protein